MKVNRELSAASGTILNLAESALAYSDSLQEFKVWAQQLWGADLDMTEFDDHLWIYPYGLTQGTCVRVDIPPKAQEEKAA